MYMLKHEKASSYQQHQTMPHNQLPSKNIMNITTPYKIASINVHAYSTVHNIHSTLVEVFRRITQAVTGFGA